LFAELKIGQRKGAGGEHGQRTAGADQRIDRGADEMEISGFDGVEPGGLEAGENRGLIVAPVGRSGLGDAPAGPARDSRIGDALGQRSVAVKGLGGNAAGNDAEQTEERE
jgi:hypothetical protein